MVLFAIGAFEVKSFGMNGGPGGVRTLDLMTASHARSQLRHRPAVSNIRAELILVYSAIPSKAGFFTGRRGFTPPRGEVNSPLLSAKRAKVSRSIDHSIAEVGSNIRAWREAAANRS
jgi:hypothetical protein